MNPEERKKLVDKLINQQIRSFKRDRGIEDALIEFLLMGFKGYDFFTDEELRDHEATLNSLDAADGVSR